MLVSHKWLQTYFEDELPSTQEIHDLLMFHSFEIESIEQRGDDWVLDIDVLPNRSADCLSHRGIAREIATLLSVPLKRDPLKDSVPAWKDAETLTVDVQDTNLCKRYMGVVMRGVRVGPSPEWLREALESIGQKSINNIVDATNYVLFDIGQPLHAFDFAHLTKDSNGVRSIAVRSANGGEKITTLTGEDYTLSTENLVIADGVSQQLLAIAGIKGGKHAEIREETVDLVLEAANFQYISVRNSSKQLKLATDASLRFQNQPAPHLVAIAMRELVQLIEQVAGGTAMGVSDCFTAQAENQPVDLELSEINALLGTTLSLEEVENILVRFQWEFSRDGEEFAITAPWERNDLTSKEAFIEEIGRVYGYKQISAVLPETPNEKPKVNKTYDYIERLRKEFAALGYDEVYSYMLRSRGVVELQNPLASDKSFLRMTIADGLRDSLTLNTTAAPLLGLDDVKLFEVGSIFTKKGEQTALAIAVGGIRTKQSKLEKILKEDIATIQKKLGLQLEGTIHDGIIEMLLDASIKLAPTHSVYQAPLLWDVTKRYVPWSQYPYILRDIAVWVPVGTDAEDVLTEIESNGTELLVRSDQFDSFEKEGRISYAWHLVFQSPNRTLTDNEVTGYMEAITEKLLEHNEWEVR